MLLDDRSVAPLVTIGPLSTVQADFVLLAGFTLVLPLAGAMLFRAELHKARFDGGLSRWA